MTPALFGQFLQEQGRLDGMQLRCGIDLLRRRNKSLGALAVDSNLLTQRQVAQLNRLQRSTDLMLGELAVKQGFLSEADLERLIILQQATHVSLGSILVDLDYLSQAELAELEAAFALQQKQYRDASQAALAQLPQAEQLQLCLNELVKGLQRICRQSVSVRAIHSQRELQRRLPYIVMQRLHGDTQFHFGLALAAQQVQHISSSLSGEPASEGYIPVAAMERFSDIVVQNACEKFSLQGRHFEADKPKAFYVGDQLPASKDLIGVQLVTEDGDFDAVFMAT